MGKQPEFEKLEFFVMKQEADAEVVSAISQVMDHYHSKLLGEDS